VYNAAGRSGWRNEMVIGLNFSNIFSLKNGHVHENIIPLKKVHELKSCSSFKSNLHEVPKMFTMVIKNIYRVKKNVHDYKEVVPLDWKNIH
jgi:hypothetical protein